MTMSQIARLELAALEEFLELDSCHPGKLLDPDSSQLYWLMNQMLYDKFHGRGWELDLLTGKFVKQGG